MSIRSSACFRLVPALAALALPAVAAGQGLEGQVQAGDQVDQVESRDAPPRVVPHWEHSQAALIQLDLSLFQQFDGSGWAEVRDTVALGRAAVSRAREAGADLGLCLAADRTLAAVATRQDLLERDAFAADSVPADAPNADEWLAAEYDALDVAGAALSAELQLVEGRLPATSTLLVELLFSQDRDEEASTTLARGLALWPRDAALHEQARAWASAVTGVEQLVTQLEERVDTLDLLDADYGGLALETVSVLRMAAGTTHYQAREFEAAAVHFDSAGRALRRSRGLPRQWSGEDADKRLAEALVNVAYSYLGLAIERWAVDRADELGAAAAEASEKALVDALTVLPEHPPAMEAVLWLGDRLMNKTDPGTPTAADVAAARDFYGRLAAACNVADWWNNYAFWCRETGTAAEEAGDSTEAQRLFEASYEAYTHAIALAPDNARFTNDTGLMLLYHLGRDLEQAEQLFLRAWKLGEEVCANPFVDSEVHAQNFEAYTDAMLNLSRVYLVRNEFDRAEDLLGKLLALAPHRIDARMAQREVERARQGQPPG